MAKLMTFLLTAALLTPAVASARQLAYTDAIVTDGNKCLIPDRSRDVRVFECTSSGDRYSIGIDGTIRTRDGYCFDHGIPQGTAFSGNRTAVHLTKCHGGKSQIWYFVNGLAQSAANSNACITVEGDHVNARAVVGQCTFKNPPRSQRTFRGGRMTDSARSEVMRVVPEAVRILTTRGAVTFNNGARMVAAGGGNIIAAGMVAAGGGNMVAAGGGNILPSGAGGFIPRNGIVDAAVVRSLFTNATMLGVR